MRRSEDRPQDEGGQKGARKAHQSGSTNCRNQSGQAKSTRNDGKKWRRTSKTVEDQVESARDPKWKRKPPRRLQQSGVHGDRIAEFRQRKRNLRRIVRANSSANALQGGLKATTEWDWPVQNSGLSLSTCATMRSSATTGAPSRKPSGAAACILLFAERI